MEDIKTLEEKIKKSRKLFAEVGSHIFLNEETIIAIEKLINRYLEKEKECKEQYEWNRYYCKELGEKNIQIQNSIPIPIIQNKILNPMKEVYDKAIDEFMKKEIPECMAGGEVAQTLDHFIAEIKEVLEERNKL